MQAHPRFESVELELMNKCIATESTGFCVKYKAASDTELWNETNNRRRKIKRKWMKSYQKSQEVSAMTHGVSQRFLNRAARHFMNESLSVYCPVESGCQCIDIGYGFMICWSSLGEGESEKRQKDWMHCIHCGNGYSKKEVDLVVKIWMSSLRRALEIYMTIGGGHVISVFLMLELNTRKLCFGGCLISNESWERAKSLEKMKGACGMMA